MKEMKKIVVQTSYDPRKGYRIDEVRRGEMPHKTKWYKTHTAMLAAIERANPGREIQVG